jgi:Cu(I)/Ag(I) efflux system membrane fusion protein
MEATLKLEGYPNEVFKGRVEFIDPTLDPKSRTVALHVHFMNPKGLLKPEMYGEVELQNVARSGLRVPFDAIVRSGTRDIVFLALDEGKFQPREVRLGAKSGDQVEVVSGLAEGQKVVTRANFLIDSESRLRASLASISGQ